ncbi:hypothetical protein SEA_GAIL_83 [Mycobacterium phage Gail]|uniref:Uncharacterized protein n=1 Tax=Mycobacterium phage Gail TaxID=2743994 RepID=A0A7D5G538_9CAUD|nr:hypothetical protein KNV16_gp026 [Mycobacterium phage Gail]QLF84646.1 hypothetical protein SEA_GAIL_83 [Mycobacterium phage Gail]
MGTKLVTGRPAEPVEGSVVRFTNFGTYPYAAIRVEGLWYLTQGKMARNSPKTWDDLLDWICNWDTLELLH